MHFKSDNKFYVNTHSKLAFPTPLQCAITHYMSVCDLCSVAELFSDLWHGGTSCAASHQRSHQQESDDGQMSLERLQCFFCQAGVG